MPRVRNARVNLYKRKVKRLENEITSLKADFRKSVDEFEKWLLRNQTEDDQYSKEPRKMIKLLRADDVLKRFEELKKEARR